MCVYVFLCVCVSLCVCVRVCLCVSWSVASHDPAVALHARQSFVLPQQLDLHQAGVLSIRKNLLALNATNSLVMILVYQGRKKVYTTTVETPLIFFFWVWGSMVYTLYTTTVETPLFSFSGSEALWCFPFFPDLWCIPFSLVFPGKWYTP